MSSKGQLTEGTGLSRIVKPVMLSVGIGALACVAVLMLLALVLSTQNIPQSMVSPMAIFAISVGALVAGFCCAKIMRHGGLMYGAISGAVLTVVVLLASLCIKDNDFGVLAVFKIIFMMLSAMLGGVLGVNTRSRRK